MFLRQDLQQTCQYEITFTQVYGDYGHNKVETDTKQLDTLMKMQAMPNIVKEIIIS